MMTKKKLVMVNKIKKQMVITIMVMMNGKSQFQNEKEGSDLMTKKRKVNGRTMTRRRHMIQMTIGVLLRVMRMMTKN